MHKGQFSAFSYRRIVLAKAQQCDPSARSAHARPTHLLLLAKVTSLTGPALRAKALRASSVTAASPLPRLPKYTEQGSASALEWGDGSRGGGRRG